MTPSRARAPGMNAGPSLELGGMRRPAASENGIDCVPCPAQRRRDRQKSPPGTTSPPARVTSAARVRMLMSAFRKWTKPSANTALARPGWVYQFRGLPRAGVLLRRSRPHRQTVARTLGETTRVTGPAPVRTGLSSAAPAKDRPVTVQLPHPSGIPKEIEDLRPDAGYTPRYLVKVHQWSASASAAHER